uniref:Transmembrane protein 236 n=1 Tax=Cynoglossus semilaevis TaxID=244447 RepID=A0A3P8WBN5_CYNSE
MPSGKTVKLILYEALQFAALVTPVFVIMERFARLVRDVRSGDHTAYWLVVAVSIAYVTSVTLLVWVPLKYLLLRQRGFMAEITLRPAALAYLVLCTFPCFAILITSSKVDGGHRLDHFAELPVSLLLFCLICVDVIERIRPCKLTGPDPDLEYPGPVLTNLEQVTTVSSQLRPDEGQNGLNPVHSEVKNGITPGRLQRSNASPSQPTPSSRAPSTAYLYSSSLRPRSYSGHLSFLWKKDGRSEVFVETFLFWLDTVEMVRVAGEPAVFYTVWVFPLYILSFLSTLRMSITPDNPLLSFAGVVLQDLPFLVLRIALIAVFGHVTPLLYLLKNTLVTLTFIYFTYLTRLKLFRRRSMF